jgi:hypothetical protein
MNPQGENAMTEFNQLTEPQVNEAMALYCKVGELPIYNKLPHGIKRSAAATAIASVLHLSLLELNEIVGSSDDFKAHVEALISTFEVKNPDKVNQEEALARAMNEIATAGMTGLPTSLEEAEAMVGQMGGECTNPDHDHSQPAQSAAPSARSVGFSAVHMATDGTPDPKVNAEFDAMVKGYDTETAPEPKGKHRFIVDSEGSTEEGK